MPSEPVNTEMLKKGMLFNAHYPDMIDTKKKNIGLVLFVTLFLCLGVFATVNIVSPGTFSTVVTNGTNNTIAFVFNHSGVLQGAVNCTLILNGTASGTNYSFGGNNSNNTNLVIYSNRTLTDANWTWFISCFNGTGNSSTENSTSRLLIVDNIPPAWAHTPLGRVIEYGNGFYYDINATHLNGASNYSINDTSRFTIDATSGVLTNNTLLAVGNWWVNVTVNDSLNHKNTTSINITVQDTTRPTWTQIPRNLTIEYGNAFYYDINATDLSINNYFINNTVNFTIDSSTGMLTNKSQLWLGTYSVNVTANDSYNNQFSLVINITTVDTTPAVSGRSSSASTTAATITWTTDQVANSSVDYGTGVDLSNSPSIDSAYSTSHSITISGSPATYYYNVTSCDQFGNCNLTGPFSFTISSASTNRGGSGSSGGSSSSTTATTVAAETGPSYIIEEGAPAPTLPPNTATDATQTWDSIEPSTNTVFSVMRPSVPVSSVSFTTSAKSSGSSMKVNVASSAAIVQLPNLNAKVYSYVEITKTNIDVASSKINFEVPKSWLSSNGVSASSVALYRLVDGKWTKLETNILSENRETVYFSANTPGFSMFAIAGESQTSAQQTTSSAAEETSGQGKTSMSTLTWVIIALIIIALLYVLLKPKKHKFYN